MKSKILFLILMTLILVSCGNSGTDPDNSNKEIMPLAVGNTWTYYVYEYHSSNKDSLRLFDTLTYHISGKKNINGEAWYYYGLSDKNANIIVTNRSDGLWVYNFKDTFNINIDSALLCYKYPTYLNEKYPNDTYGFYIASMNTEVNSPAGNFSCIWYINIQEQKIGYSGQLFSPGVGEIVTDQINKIDNSLPVPDTVWIRLLLASYKLYPK